MNGIGRDILHAWRGLLHQRAFTAAALMMLALGIAATSAIFATVQAVVFKLPFDDPDRIVTVHARGASGENLSISLDRFESWRQASDVFESVAAYALVSPVMTGRDAAVRLQAEAMTESMFTVLGVQPILGRNFRDDDGPVVVLSHAFWRSRFNADPGVLGQPILLDDVATTVIGVMPSGFDGPRSRPGDVWLPLSVATRRFENARGRPFSVSVLARLADGVDVQTARARIQAMQWDAARTRWTAHLETAREDFLYKDALSRMNLLAGAVALVMLMACVNVASLLLGRNVSRRRELAVRLAMGARPWHITRQIAIESLMLSGGAAVFGLLLAWWTVTAMVPLIPGWFPRIEQIRVDWGVAAFATLAAVICGLGVSVWPAWSASRQDLSAVMKSGERGNSARRARTALVVLEATLAMIVLTAAAMMVGSFNRLNPTSPGFDVADRTKFSIRVAGPRYRDPSARVAAVEEIAARLRALPGVVDASSVTHLPLTGTTTVFPVRVKGREEAGRTPTVHFRAALPNYLTLLGMPILRGRDLTPADAAGAQPVAVVNEALAARMLHGNDPLGSELVIDEPDGAVVRRIVGVVRDVRGSGNDLRPRLEVFVPYAQSPLTLASFVVRTRGADAQTEAGIRRVIGAFDAALPVDRVQTLRAIVEKSVDVQRLFARLMGVFGVVAVALAFVGLYSVTAWSVAQRTREIGVRVALGATSADLRRMVLRYGATVGATGAIVGSMCAFASSTWLESYLYGFDARQPILYGVLGVAFVSVVTLASYMPARRAMRVDPMIALRME
jgi:putative ABC transport system permease protein